MIKRLLRTGFIEEYQVWGDISIDDDGMLSFSNEDDKIIGNTVYALAEQYDKFERMVLTD